MDQLHLMTVFIAVAEEQGFSPAARRLNMSPPAVTRAIASLEDKLSIKLLTRTTRYVRVTEAGERYLEDARRILLAVEQANEAAIGINSEPKGHLTVTAPVLFGQKYVMPGIVEYLNTYPETQVNAVFLDRVVNLLEEGFDVGVRIGQLPDSTMQAKNVGEVRLVLVASPQYLARYGIPKTPAELKQHTLIASSTGNMTNDWQFSQQNKKQIVRIQPRLTVTSNQAAINAATSGLGITRLISYQVADELKKGILTTVLSDFQLPALPVHIIHREGPMASSKVRCFIDLMVQRLRADKGLN
ncbi:MAG: LysR family transcriptional regulator [Oleispira sp.]|nr:LysR family transcriptional regulator [Oleispira sp.]MBL4880359.1 LysR family transcriptional regulator [Oleispira sp.]